MSEPLRQPPVRSRPGGLAVLGFGLCAVAWATLGPAETGQEGWSTCLVCGSRGVADVIVNLLLFVPLGAGLAMLTGRVGASFLGALLLSLVVELAQQVIPGRDPSLRDLVFNSLGGGLGGAMVPLTLAALRLDPGWAARLSVLAAALAGAVIGATGFLTRPALPDSLYFGQWTPRLGQFERYRGRVLEVAVGGAEVGRRRIDSALIRERFLAGERLRIRVAGAPPPARLAPIFSVFDRERREILLVGADGADLVLHLRTRSRELRLDQPDLRLWGALASVAPGDTFDIEVTSGPRGMCASVDGEGGCGIGVSAGSGWTLLYALQSSPRWAREWLGHAWMAALLLPVGFFTRRRRETLVTVAVVGVGLLLVPAWAGLQPSPPGELAGAVTGWLAGALLRRWLASDYPPAFREDSGSRSVATTSDTHRSMRR